MSFALPEMHELNGACLLSVRVTPRASRTGVQGVVNGRLCVRLQAPPVEGAANKALEAFVAKALSLPKSAVTVVRGASSREKVLRITGRTHTALTELLKDLTDGG